MIGPGMIGPGMVDHVEVGAPGMDNDGIRALRESKGMSQAEFAGWLNERLNRSYDRQKISRWEVGAERIPQHVAGMLGIAALERPRQAPEAPRQALVVALANQKGGVAKTASAVNLAYMLVLTGKRVLLVDADPQGNATAHVGVGHARIVQLNSQEQTLYHVLVGRRPIPDVIIKACSLGASAFWSQPTMRLEIADALSYLI